MSVTALLTNRGLSTSLVVKFCGVSRNLGAKWLSDKTVFATLAGQIVHSALESITTALDHAGCLSIHDSMFVAVLRELGGFTKIIEGKIEDLVSALRINPRAENTLEQFSARLRTKVPELRTVCNC